MSETRAQVAQHRFDSLLRVLSTGVLAIAIPLLTWCVSSVADLRERMAVEESRGQASHETLSQIRSEIRSELAEFRGELREFRKALAQQGK